MTENLARCLSTSEWHITEPAFDASRQQEMESIFTLGNGYLGSRGVLEELPEGSSPGTFFAGLFEGTGAQVPELINAPNPVTLQISYGGQKLGIGAMDSLAHRRILDLKHGLLYRETRYQTAVAKRRIRYQSVRFFSTANPHIAVMRVAITPIDHAMTFTVRTAVDTAVTNRGLVTEGAKRHFHIHAYSRVDGADYICTRTLENGVLIAYACMLSVSTNRRTRRERHRSFELRLRKGQTAVLTKYVSLFTSREVSPSRLRSRAISVVRRAARAGFDALLRRHQRHWDRLWRSSDVAIAGNQEIQRAVRFNIYHLLIAAPHQPFVDASIGARCLSGEGYRGHVFWETELFTLPFFTYTLPDIARQVLRYRCRRLDAARRNAAARGYAGAMFPWESADDGRDVTPTWHRDLDGRVIEIHTMQQEHHITADIAYAIWVYFQATGDVEFMLEDGLALCLETARFWTSRVEFDRKKRRFVIKSVIGPDEFHVDVNNNAFTNALARWNLFVARRLYQQLRRTHRAEVAKIATELKLTRSELHRFREIEEKIFIPWRQRKGLLEQFEGYFERRKLPLTDWDAGGLPQLPARVKLDRIGRTQYVKQADVVMLAHLLPDMFTPEKMRRNFEYYEKRTLHKSSLSAPVHACVAARLGLKEIAYRYFLISAEADLKNLYGNTSDGIHAASLGGTWQAVVTGFCGVSPRSGLLNLDPHLPRQWKAVKTTITWKGFQLDLNVSRSALTLRTRGATTAPPRKLPVRVCGALRRLEAGKTYRFLSDPPRG
jgi:kojibiose phosphorylase